MSFIASENTFPVPAEKIKWKEPCYLSANGKFRIYKHYVLEL